MEAGNKGAFEAGGTSIGLNITLPQEQEANKYQTISLDFHYFYARKVMFVKYASAFVCFPGGFGTLEEMLEILTLKQLGQHAKPAVFLNTADFFRPLLGLFEQLYRERFTRPEHRELYHVAEAPGDVFAHLEAYRPPKPAPKWFSAR